MSKTHTITISDGDFNSPQTCKIYVNASDIKQLDDNSIVADGTVISFEHEIYYIGD